MTHKYILNWQHMLQITTVNKQKFTVLVISCYQYNSWYLNQHLVRKDQMF